MQKEEIIFQGGIGMKNKRPLVKWTWSQVLAGISTGKIDGHEFMPTVEKIRKSVFKSESAKNLKGTLPFIFPSVTLADGADIGSQEIVDHNGACQIDIDYDEMTDMPGRMQRAMEIKKRLLGDPYILLMFLSPQWGVKILCRIPADRREHDKNYRGLVRYFKDKYDLTHDPACIGVKRLMFLAYDPVPYHNQHAIVFEIPKETGSLSNNRIETSISLRNPMLMLLTHLHPQVATRRMNCNWILNIAFQTFRRLELTSRPFTRNGIALECL